MLRGPAAGACSRREGDHHGNAQAADEEVSELRRIGETHAVVGPRRAKTRGPAAEAQPLAECARQVPDVRGEGEYRGVRMGVARIGDCATRPAARSRPQSDAGAMAHRGSQNAKEAEAMASRRPRRYKPTPIDRLVWRIRDLYRANKFNSTSAAMVSAAVRKHPRSPDVHLAVAEFRELADIHQGTWRCTRHERAYRRVLELDPENARAWENLAAVLDIADRLPEAARAAQRAVRFGEDRDAVAILSRIRAQQGRRAEARRLANTIRRARSEFARSTAKEVLEGSWDTF